MRLIQKKGIFSGIYGPKICERSVILGAEQEPGGVRFQPGVLGMCVVSAQSPLLQSPKP